MHKSYNIKKNINMTYTLITRSLILYILILILLRIMGKRQLGEMQPYELVITLIFADLATVPMSDTALPLIHGIIPLLTLVCIHYLLSLLERKSIYLRKLINGKPIILIDPKGINYKNLKKCNMNFNDLQEALRSNGNFTLEEVLYAIMQTNGTLSVLTRSENNPINPKSVNIEVEENSLPIIIVSEGKIIKENAKIAKIDQNYITENIKSLGFNSIDELLVLTLTSNGKLYVQGKTGIFKTKDINFKGEW